jgi:hypothetical protein
MQPVHQQLDGVHAVWLSQLVSRQLIVPLFEVYASPSCSAHTIQFNQVACCMTWLQVMQQVIFPVQSTGKMLL